MLVLFCMRGCGCIERPAFPAPSDFFGRTVVAQLGRIAPRECGHLSQIRHPEVRALRCTCTAGRASKDERPGRRPSRRIAFAMLLRMTGIGCLKVESEKMRSRCCCRHCEERSSEAIQTPSFRGDAKHRTRNLEIPGLVLAHHPGMTAFGLLRCARNDGVAASMALTQTAPGDPPGSR